MREHWLLEQPVIAVVFVEHGVVAESGQGLEDGNSRHIAPQRQNGQSKYPKQVRANTLHIFLLFVASSTMMRQFTLTFSDVNRPSERTRTKIICIYC